MSEVQEVLRTIRKNWRTVLLIIFVIASVIALFAPGLTNGVGTNATQSNSSSGLTNLQYGIELSGGTRIRAPLVGLTAEQVNVSATEQANLSRTLAADLRVSATDIQTRTDNGTATVEVFSRNISQGAFANALQNAGYDVQQNQIRSSVTEQTYDTAVDVLQDKVSASGLDGGTVRTVSSGDQRYIQVEVPNQNSSEVRRLVADQGQVQTVAYFTVQGDNSVTCEGPIGQEAGTVVRTSGETCNVTVTQSQAAFQRIGTVQQDSRTGQPGVPVTLTDQAGEQFLQAMQQYGFADQANASSGQVPGCRYDLSNGGHCLLTVRDGEVVYSAGVRPDLARSFASGDFANDPAYSTSAPNASAAQGLQVDLQAGSLPTTLNFQQSTVQYTQSSVAQDFKTFSVITGLIAVLAVATVVFARYRELWVAIPMVVTALAEVLILLGFAAAVGMALDLSYIAGFIAVIGTGVDDLVIIADEILQSEVKTGRVFKSRFRRAFWVIGAAAVTTIIAMSPLAVLSLGDLQGFATITIVGVVIGVLITRPAYGNILRTLLTDA